jgi:hypothetical protein
MTNEDIESLIDLMNDSNGRLADRQRIFVCPLSNRVDHALVWSHDPRGGIGNEDSCSFYFVKDQTGSYVAAIQDGGSDLHAVTKAEHRGNGHISSALRDVILPDLHHRGRKRQPVTFANAEAGERLARRLGFVVTGSGKAEYDLSVFQHVPLARKPRALTKDEYDAMVTRIQRAKLYLKMVKQQLEQAYGDLSESSLFIDELIYEGVANLDDRIRTFIERIHFEDGLSVPE